MSEDKSNNRRPLGFLTSTVGLIRVCSVIMLAFLMVGHLSAYPWSSTHNPQETRLVDSMKSIDFVFLGEHSTYWNLYFGWGFLVAVLLFALAAILWIVSDLASLAPRRLGVITGIISAVSGVGAYISFRYFYVPPALSYLAICVISLAVSGRLLRAPTPTTRPLST